MRKILAVCVLMAGLGGFGPIFSWATAATVDYGTLQLFSDMPVYIALEKGYFKEQGIELKLNPFAGGAPMMAPMATGQVQAGNSGIAITLFNGMARDMPLVLVASTAQMIPGHNDDYFILRPELKEAIKRPADLKGRKVALNTAGSPLIYQLGKALESEGLTLKDVEVVYVPWPDMGVALKNKAIDVGLAAEPFATLHEARGLAIRWKGAADVVKDPYWTVAGVVFNSDWAKKNREVAQGFMVAWIKGARDLFQAAERGPNRQEIVDLAVKYTRLKDKALYDKMEWAHLGPNGYLDKKSVEDQINWYFKNGLITHKLTIDKVVDDSFVKFAVDKLGETKEVHRH